MELPQSCGCWKWNPTARWTLARLGLLQLQGRKLSQLGACDWSKWHISELGLRFEQEIGSESPCCATALWSHWLSESYWYSSDPAGSWITGWEASFTANQRSTNDVGSVGFSFFLSQAWVELSSDHNYMQFIRIKKSVTMKSSIMICCDLKCLVVTLQTELLSCIASTSYASCTCHVLCFLIIVTKLTMILNF